MRLRGQASNGSPRAQNVFRCDFASITVACADNQSSSFISREGAAVETAAVARNTMCDHAMLLADDEIFVVPDMLEDWRFAHFSFSAKKGDPMRFYASAPILLSNSEEEREEERKVQVGRLVIMRKEPWKDFGEVEAELLMDIAKMAQEALENEYLHRHLMKVEQIQRETVSLSWHLNLAADEEVSQDKGKGARNILLCPRQMQRVVDTAKDMVGAASVTAVDVSDFRLQSHASGTSVASFASPRSGTPYGGYPSMPWLSSSSSGGLSQGSDSDQASLHRAQSDVNLDASNTSPSEWSRSDQVPAFQPGQRPFGHHSRSTSSSNSLDDADLYSVAPGSTANIIAFAGERDCCPAISTTAQSHEICSLLTTIRREKKLTKPQRYENRTESTGSDEEEGEGEQESLQARNPLTSLMPSSIQSYCTIPVFANDRVQPLFLFIVAFKHDRMPLEAERLFMYSIGLIVGATCLRQQARLSDRAQLDFIRSVQHELRTPLNGILGITDFLRQSLVSDDMTEKLDLSEDGVLAGLLESIRLSGVNLSTILDDVLDFGAVAGLRGNAATATRIEEIDLVREVEDGCLDELEHIAMHERQDQHLQIYRGYYAVPTLVIKVAAELQTRFRTDRSKVRKILSKFVANALRYSNEQELVEVMVVPSSFPNRYNTAAGDQWVDFIIQDTGIGMSKDFVQNSLLKPFSKADSFSQGVGLGVTIAASLISQMGGRLHIQSDLGKGTRVQVSLPFGLRPTMSSRSSPSQLYRPYQVKTAKFFGFTLKGHEKIVEMIQERLLQNGIGIVEAHQDAELVILKESVAVVRSDEDEQEAATSAETVVVPRPVGPRARVLMVTRNALRSRTSNIFDGLPTWLFRPPFGPSSLDAMDEFLREESPIVLKSVPTPTSAAEDNMKRVQKQSQDVVSKGEDLKMNGSTSAAPPATATSPAEQTTKMSANGQQARKAAKAVSTNATSAPLPAPGITSDATKPFRVLVVEDNYVNMRLITAVLTKGGYSFVEAKDGIEAVDQYKSFEPSVVLLDISLPLQDGFEACLQMRSHSMMHVPKIIAITALSSTEDKIKGLEVCGMDDWRTKPLSIKSLRTDLIVWKKEWDEVWQSHQAPHEAAAPPTQIAVA